MNGIKTSISRGYKGEIMEDSIIFILGLVGVIATSSIAGILVLEATRETSR